MKQSVWVGASGSRYVYEVSLLPKKFTEYQHVNYIYCKLTDGEWVPVYIGHGILEEIGSNHHHQIRCIREKGATHIHIHFNENENDRLREEVDLLDNLPQAYAPAGCNMKAGSDLG